MSYKIELVGDRIQITLPNANPRKSFTARDAERLAKKILEHVNLLKVKQVMES